MSMRNELIHEIEEYNQILDDLHKINKMRATNQLTRSEAQQFAQLRVDLRFQRKFKTIGRFVSNMNENKSLVKILVHTVGNIYFGSLRLAIEINYSNTKEARSKRKARGLGDGLIMNTAQWLQYNNDFAKALKARLQADNNEDLEIIKTLDQYARNSAKPEWKAQAAANIVNTEPRDEKDEKREDDAPMPVDQSSRYGVPKLYSPEEIELQRPKLPTEGIGLPETFQDMHDADIYDQETHEISLPLADEDVDKPLDYAPRNKKEWDAWDKIDAKLTETKKEWDEWDKVDAIVKEMARPSSKPKRKAAERLTSSPREKKHHPVVFSFENYQPNEGAASASALPKATVEQFLSPFYPFIVSLLSDAKEADVTQTLKNNPSFVNLTSAAQLIVQRVLERPALCNIGYGLTPLIAAVCLKPQARVVATLLEHKAEPNCVIDNDHDLSEINGCSALMLACFHGDEEVVNLLLANKADPNLINTKPNAKFYQWSALHFAIAGGHLHLVEKLLRLHLRLDAEKIQLAHYAMSRLPKNLKEKMCVYIACYCEQLSDFRVGQRAESRMQDDEPGSSPDVQAMEDEPSSSPVMVKAKRRGRPTAGSQNSSGSSSSSRNSNNSASRNSNSSRNSELCLPVFTTSPVRTPTSAPQAVSILVSGRSGSVVPVGMFNGLSQNMPSFNPGFQPAPITLSHNVTPPFATPAKVGMTKRGAG